MGFAVFFGEPFLADGIDLKIVARWRYDWCANARENFQNLKKWVQTVQSLFAPGHFDHLEAS